MALIVQKFGGTSVGTTERIQNVARRVAKWRAAGHDVVVVPSAMAGETNRLLALAREIQPQPDPREMDVVASTGEQVTIGLLAMALLERGVLAKSYTGWQVKVLSDSAFTRARIVSIDEERIRERGAELYDRCFYPVGTARQLAAILAHGSRKEALARVSAPALVIHGDADQLIPVQALFHCAQSLAALGIPAQWHISSGVGHGIDQEGLRQGGEFLANCFAAGK